MHNTKAVSVITAPLPGGLFFSFRSSALGQTAEGAFSALPPFSAVPCLTHASVEKLSLPMSHFIANEGVHRKSPQASGFRGGVGNCKPCRLPLLAPHQGLQGFLVT